MARMRTIKPETFASETLASLPLSARWAFAGLWTYADDSGRGRGHPQLIKAAIWPLDDDVTAADVEDHLRQLEAVGVICRYEAGGKQYLHVVNFAEHQHPNRPVPSKLPECPHTTHGGLNESAVSPHTRFTAPMSGAVNGSAGLCSLTKAPTVVNGHPDGVAAGESVHTQLSESSLRTHKRLSAVDVDVDVDVDVVGAPRARSPHMPNATTRGQQILDDHLAAGDRKPPRDVIARVSKAIEGLLDERFEPDQIRAGLALLRQRPRCGPGLLPDLVHEAATNSGHQQAANSRSSTTDQRVAAGMALAEKYREEDS